MKKHKQIKDRISYSKWFLMLFTLVCSLSIQIAHAAFGPPTKYEAETSNLGNASVSSANTGYTGSGYVTGLTSEWSYISFDKSNPSTTLAKIDIRYANGTVASVTNLALYVGSTKIQNLSFPTTANWTTWSTLSVTFTLPGGYQNIKIDGESNAASSVNIDFSELSLDDGVAAPTVEIPTFSPAAGTYTSIQSVTISTATSGATIYYTQDGSTPTTGSTVYSGAISVATSKTIKALATKSGSTNSAIGTAAYVINLPPPAPGSFTQTAPASGATGVSTSPAFSWAASSNASSYSLVVSTSSTYTSPIINQTGITGTSYTSGTALANSTVYYWKVTATNVTGSTVSTNAGLSFTTTAPLPVVATPTFSPGAGTYSSSQSVTISTATSGSNIYYTQDGSTPTTASTLYSGAINVNTTRTIKAIATKSGSTNSAIGTAAYTINIPVPAPGAFTQTAPASGATGVSRVASLSWAASSNASSYTVVVSTNSNLSSPVVNQTGVTGTSYTTSQLAASTLHYWRVSAVNATGTTIATNSGISFTTAAASSGTSALNTFQAEGYNAMAGVSNNTTFIGGLDNNDWIRFDNIDFGGGVTNFTASIAVDPAYAGQKVEVRLGSTTGTLAGTLTVANTGGWNNFTAQTTTVTGASGVQTLYLVFKGIEGIGNFDWFKFENNNPPTAFLQTSPAGGATGVAVTPNFTWGTSANASGYTLVVSTNSSYTNPVINASGLTSTNYTPGIALAGNTLYYWKVTASNSSQSQVASNAGLSFTTLVPPVPGSFNQTSPGSGSTSVARVPSFTWGSSSNAASYSLVVSTNSTLTSPVINVNNITGTSYTTSVTLAASTQYYWRVTATNSSGSTNATNGGIAFTTGASTGGTYYVSTTGVDSPSNGGSGNPFRTLAYAASRATTPGSLIYINAGTYIETEPAIIALGVDVQGAGEANTILKSSGVTIAQGVDPNSNDWKLWYDGSLIQLITPHFSVFRDPKSTPLAPANGNQTLSGFTIDGTNKSLKAGVWVENRNNVTMHHVTIKSCKQRGAVFGTGDKDWYIYPTYYMTNTKIYNCTFINNGMDIPYNPQTGSGAETLGNLCLATLDGADIYNINITDNVGYGIKFIFDGFIKNVKIHDCTINVNETDAHWGEKISIEFWNIGPGNEIYNINSNTWLSMVNHPLMFNAPTGTENLKIYNVKIIDGDGVSSKEAIEVALPGVEIYNCYIEDKGFGLAIWDMGRENVVVRNNIFRNTREHTFFAGPGPAIYIENSRTWAYTNINIYNNVFDTYYGQAIRILGRDVSNVNIMNNVFLNTAINAQTDIQVNGANLTNIIAKNNLKYDAGNKAWGMDGIAVDPSNIQGNPGFKNTGNRWDTYYQPASPSSFAVDKGRNVGIPFAGTAPDIGKWERGLTSSRQELAESSSEDNTYDVVSSYPNPTTGLVKIIAKPGVEILAIQVMNLQGRTLLNKLYDKFNTVDIDLREYENDVYIFRIKHQRGVVNKKIVLVK